MSRYDGLIIPRSYGEYINKTDAATLSQALQLPGVMDSAPTANSNHPAKSGGIYNAINNFQPKKLLQSFTVEHRPESANITENNTVSYFLATANMTEGKPAADGYILNFGWDNSTYTSQLFIPNNGTEKMAYRNHQPQGWSDWVYLENTIIENLNLIGIPPQLDFNNNSQICCIKNGILFINVTFIVKTAFTLQSRQVIANIPKKINGGNCILECSIKKEEKFAYLRTTSAVTGYSDIVCDAGDIGLVINDEISIRCAIPII